MIATSLKPDAEILRIPPTIFPKTWFLGRFEKLLFVDKYFLRYFLNSIIVASVGTFVSTFGSVIAGFVFAKINFRFKNVLFFLLLATIMVPFECYMVPLFNFAVKLGVLDTYPGLIMPIIISSFGIFFLRQFVQTIPDSLIDAARIDGASVWKVFIEIILPISLSATAVLEIFQFMKAWGDFIWTLGITKIEKMYVMELGLTKYRDQFSIDYGTLMAATSLAIVPVLTVFIVLRRYIITGITLSGIKG